MGESAYDERMSTPSDLGALWQQVAWLLILPIPIASVSWTITHEEIFREVRDYCAERSQACRRCSSASSSTS